MGVESFGNRPPEREGPRPVVLPPMVLPLTLNITLDPRMLDELIGQVRQAWAAAVLGGISDAMSTLNQGPESQPPGPQRPVRPPTT